ncbi:hypothetical protein DSO57_1036278 [Entomophthora muscae]|uniref:Uncharacterized protein n=1 Tax=Entomophthora muscae TaxID=34485 RepID=A0ACC2SC79_9FUNG|nr:hypothetical protein DSO57_1036278 [Entomophthora muscae]
MEGGSIALKAIQERGHLASVCPAGHADIHLGNFVFLGTSETVQERQPQAFNDLYIGVLDHESLFGCQMIADLFAQIVFHVNMGNQLQKDKRLPPFATATYQPITTMINEEYHERLWGSWSPVPKVFPGS